MTVYLPHLLGGDGVLASSPLPLDDVEQQALHASAEVVCQAIEGLSLVPAGLRAS